MGRNEIDDTADKDQMLEGDIAEDRNALEKLKGKIDSIGDEAKEKIDSTVDKIKGGLDRVDRDEQGYYDPERIPIGSDNEKDAINKAKEELNKGRFEEDSNEKFKEDSRPHSDKATHMVRDVGDDLQEHVRLYPVENQDGKFDVDVKGESHRDSDGNPIYEYQDKGQDGPQGYYGDFEKQGGLEHLASWGKYEYNNLSDKLQETKENVSDKIEEIKKNWFE